MSIVHLAEITIIYQYQHWLQGSYVRIFYMYKHMIPLLTPPLLLQCHPLLHLFVMSVIV